MPRTGPTAASVRPLDHTGDVGFEVRAAGIEDLFEAVRTALLRELMARPPDEGEEREELSLEAPALDRLLLRWLDELLFVTQTRGRVPVAASVAVEPGGAERGWTSSEPGGRPGRLPRRRRDSGSAGPPVEQPAGWRLHARLTLAPLDPDVHGWRGEVKGVTYHGLEVVREGKRWLARVILDV